MFEQLQAGLPTTTDSPPGPSTDKHVFSFDHEHECTLGFSSEISCSTSAVRFVSNKQSAKGAGLQTTACIPHQTGKLFSTLLGSSTVLSLLSFLTTDRLYLPNDLLRDAVVMLLIAIISQLLVQSGDIETNPGPIASDKPTMNQLISLKLNDGSYLRIIRWVASLSRSECVDFAHLLLDDSVKVETLQKIPDVDDFVRAVLEDWLSSGDDTGPHTWAALVHCMEEAGLPGNLVKAIRDTLSSGYAMEKLRKKFLDMLRVLQNANLSEERLFSLKLFLSDGCDKSFENCISIEEIIEQLKLKLKINIFNIDMLKECSEHFQNDEVSRSIQQYDEYLNWFLSNTTVKELPSKIDDYCLDDTELLTITLRGDALMMTLKDLEMLLYKIVGTLYKKFILYGTQRGSVIITWIFPASITSTLSQHLANEEHVEPQIERRIEAVNVGYIDPNNAKELMWKVEARIKITNLSTQGYPGIGKTSVLCLVMGKPPVTTRTSTDLADPPSRYIISKDSKGVIQWKNVSNDEMAKMVYGAMKEKNRLADNTQPIPNVVTASQSKPTSPSGTVQFEHSVSSTSTFSSSSDEPDPFSFSDYSWFPQLLHDLNKSENSNVIFDSHWVFVSDCGGQPPFLDAAALFRQNVCLQIFPLKLHESLNKASECSYYVNDECASFDDSCMMSTHKQTIEALAKSVALIRPPYLASEQVSDCPKSSKFMIVGTFADLYGNNDCTETIEDKESILERVLKPYSKFLVRRNKIIMQVNAGATSTSAERKHYTEQLQELIFDAADITIPVTLKLLWFVFYHRLLTIAEEENKSVFTLEECYRIGKFLGMGSDLETKEAIELFHNIGVIMHFDSDEDNEKTKKLRKSVVIQTKTVFKNVSRLISVSFLNADFLKKLNIFPPTGHKERLQMRGFFNKSLVDKCICIGSSTDSELPEIDAQLLLDILEHVKAIIAIKDTADYFMPCALPYASKDKSLLPPPWVIRLKVQHVEVCYIPIPCSYLPTLVIFLLQQKETFTVTESSKRQYRNFISLEYKRRGDVNFFEQCCQIEVSYSWYKEFPNDCLDIRKLILDAIPLVEKRLHIETNIITKVDSFLCSCDDSDDRHVCFPTDDPLSEIARCEKTRQPCKLKSWDLCWLSASPSQSASPHPPTSPSVITNPSTTVEEPLVCVDLSHIPDGTLDDSHLSVLVTALSTVYQWFPLGIHLGLRYSKLKIIEGNQRGQIEMCKIDMLAMWLQGPEIKRNKQFLKKALQQLGSMLTLDTTQ